MPKIFLLFVAIIALFAYQKNSSGEAIQSDIQIKSEFRKEFTASSKNIALIYKGEGSCIEDCSESAAYMAKLAGLEPVYVSPDNMNLEIFKNAAIWIQPGGESLIVIDHMSHDLMRALQEFIQNGGGYVGFCAGGFLADHDVHDAFEKGLGIIPARAIDYEQAPAAAAMLDLKWNGKVRSVYWEQGPHFQLFNDGQIFTPFVYYPTGEIAGLYGQFFDGRVAVTGVHPEAPQYWRDDIHADDPDGLDYDLAIDMIRWAAGKTEKFGSDPYSSGNFIK